LSLLARFPVFTLRSQGIWFLFHSLQFDGLWSENWPDVSAAMVQVLGLGKSLNVETVLLSACGKELEAHWTREEREARASSITWVKSLAAWVSVPLLRLILEGIKGLQQSQ
jgi:hypothetical protein